MKLHRLLSCVGLSLMAAACSSSIADSNRVAAEGLAPVSDRFQQALVEGYGRQGDRNYNERDWWGARLMYRKAHEAGTGQVVPVGEPKEWQQIRGLPWPGVNDKVGKVGLEGNAYRTAVDYRNRLVPWVEANKGRDPNGTAAMQVAYECWLDEVSADNDAAAAACGFDINRLTQTTQTTVVTPPPAPAPTPAPAPRTFQVFFDFNSTEITPEAARIIMQAADEARRNNVRLVVATGHADRSGTTDYNQRLSERRAAVIRAALSREGVTGNIQTSGRGESDPLVATDDGVREPRNRRVEIVLQ